MFPEDINELKRYFVCDNLSESVTIHNINDILNNPILSDDIKSLFRRLMQLKLEILSHFQFFRSPTG